MSTNDTNVEKYLSFCSLNWVTPYISTIVKVSRSPSGTFYPYLLLLLLMCVCSIISTVLQELDQKSLDVKALRAFRVLRPLRIVSGVPSNLSLSLTILLDICTHHIW